MDELHWSDEKLRLFNLEQNSIVSASAGTGKTTALTELIIRWIEDAPDERSLHDLVAITFTEKAAGEMKQRIRDFVLNRLEQGQNLQLWERVRRSLSASYIGTIHAFCTRILRERAYQFDLDPDFSVLQEREASRQFSRIVKEHISEAIRRGESDVQELLRNFGFQEQRTTTHDLQGVLETLLQQCRNNGIRPVDAREHTEKFIDRIPSKIDRRVNACIEAVDEILDLPIDEDTATGKSLRQFQKVAASLQDWLSQIGPNTDIVEFAEWRNRAESILKGNVSADLSEAREPLRKYLGYPKSQPNSSSRGDLQKMVALLHAEPLHDALLDHLIRINRTYRSYKRNRGALDFDDLLFTVRDGLRDDQILRDHYKSRFDLLLIDEFQDVNRIQYELLFYLSEKKNSSNRISEEESFRDQIELEPGKFVVVGDPKQSIYMFRGADVSLFQQTIQDVTERNGHTFHFRENFRSVPDLVHFFNGFCRTLFSSREDPFYVAYDQRDDLLPTRDDPRGNSTPCVELLTPPGLTGSSDEMRAEEAETLANRIKKLLDGTSGSVQVTDSERADATRAPEPGDVAVLFRSTSHVQQYERAFRQRDIPYQLFKGQNFFNQPEIRDISNLFSFLATPNRPTPLLGYLKSPLVGVTDDALVQLKHRAETEFDGDITDAFWNVDPSAFTEGNGAKIDRAREQLRDFLQRRDRIAPSDLVRHVRCSTDVDGVLAHQARGEQALANLDKLEALLNREDENTMRFFEAARYLQQSVHEEAVEEEAPVSGNGTDQVQIMTVHSAKGLEFPIVCIADMGSVKPRVHDQHLFDPDLGVGIRWRNPETDIPHHTWSYTRIRERRKEKTKAESERLLYVAMTRAQDYLMLSGWYPEGGWGHPRKKGTWWKKVEDVYNDHTGDSLMDTFEQLDGPLETRMSFRDRTVPVHLVRPSRSQDDETHPDPPQESPHSEPPELRIDPDAEALDVPFNQTRERTNRFAVTELVELLKCPRRFAFLVEHSVPEDPGEEEIVPRKTTGRHIWKQAGTLAHELLEQIDVTDIPSENRLAHLARQQEAGRFLSGEIRQEVVERVRNGLHQIHDTHLQTADEIDRERAFAYRLHAPSSWSVTIEGTMDLFVRTGENVLILDYKYAHRRAEKVRDDRLQLLLYVLPYLNATDVEPESITCALCYLREEGEHALYELTTDRNRLEQFRKRTISAINTAFRQEGTDPMNWEGEPNRGPCDDRRCGFIPYCWDDQDSS